MTDNHYPEDEELKRQYTLSLITAFESRFFHSYAYGALSIFIYLVCEELEPGILLGLTQFLGLASLYMWYATNSWVQKVKIEIDIQIHDPKGISDRYKSYAQQAIVYGSVSFVIMPVASWYFIWYL